MELRFNRGSRSFALLWVFLVSIAIGGHSWAADCSDSAIQAVLRELNPNLGKTNEVTEAVDWLKKTAVLVESALDVDPYPQGSEEIFQCNGVLIDKRHVLTNAHCVVGSSKATIMTWERSEIPVEGVVDWGKTEDTVMLRLSQDAPYDPERARPLRNDPIKNHDDPFLIWPSCLSEIDRSHTVGTVDRWKTTYFGENSIVLSDKKDGRKYETLSGSRVVDAELNTSGLMVGTVASFEIGSPLNRRPQVSLRPVFLRRSSGYGLHRDLPLESLRAWSLRIKSELFGSYLWALKLRGDGAYWNEYTGVLAQINHSAKNWPDLATRQKSYLLLADHHLELLLSRLRETQAIDARILEYALVYVDQSILLGGNDATAYELKALLRYLETQVDQRPSFREVYDGKESVCSLLQKAAESDWRNEILQLSMKNLLCN